MTLPPWWMQQCSLLKTDNAKVIAAITKLIDLALHFPVNHGQIKLNVLRECSVFIEYKLSRRSNSIWISVSAQFNYDLRERYLTVPHAH
ncbi:hypothetical protein T4C_13175 [Trichinella pseudospiralis]|uniref:Uncharacterized protein n=1 Tax=Trichinella pseudospiralis TaxID=6337 RepID=A0A0V1JJW6_TRIPS|nr:hypothetical protein T4C_13175 [Trichinella pseudospiralis]